jgi:carbon monoxide dehydrogenase subunit G
MLIRILIVVAAIVVLAILAGLAVSKTHRASRTIVLPAAPDAVFAAIADFGKHAEWRKGVKKIDLSGPMAVGTIITEDGSNGPMSYRIDVLTPPTKLVTRITGSRQFGGTWTYDLKPSGAGTELTLTEDGEIYNPIFRLVARFIMGYHATMDGYLASLKTRLGR